MKQEDNAVEIARYLIQELGLEGALGRAVEERQAAMAAERFYDLSIWREVVKLLRDAEHEMAVG